jgi:hypothetical protein
MSKCLFETTINLQKCDSTLASTVWCFPKHFNLMILERFYRAPMVDRTGVGPQTFEHVNFNGFKIEFKGHNKDLSQ